MIGFGASWITGFRLPLAVRSKRSPSIITLAHMYMSMSMNENKPLSVRGRLPS